MICTRFIYVYCIQKALWSFLTDLCHEILGERGPWIFYAIWKLRSGIQSFGAFCLFVLIESLWRSLYQDQCCYWIQ